MSIDFDAAFAPLAPKGTARYTLTGVKVNSTKDVVLIGTHAGRDNKRYMSALMKLQNENKGELGGQASLARLDANDAQFAAIFARTVFTGSDGVGWENVRTPDGKPVPSTPENVEGFLIALAKQRPAIAGATGAIAFYFLDPDNFCETPRTTAEALGEE